MAKLSWKELPIKWFCVHEAEPLEVYMDRVVFLMKDGSFRMAKDHLTPVGLIDRWCYLPLPSKILSPTNRPTVRTDTTSEKFY